MVGLQNVRAASMLAPISAAAAYTTTAADSVALGVKSDYATIIVHIGAIAASMTVLKLTESDASGSGYSDVTGFVGGTNFTLPTSSDGGKFVVFQVDMKARKRYLKVEATAGGTTVLGISCIFSRGKIGTNSAADSGALALVIG
jgi:hypothetical protein